MAQYNVPGEGTSSWSNMGRAAIKSQFFFGPLSSIGVIFTIKDGDWVSILWKILMKLFLFGSFFSKRGHI